MTSYIIRNATIVDGTGKAPYIGDIAVQHDSFVPCDAVDQENAIVIDGSGLHLLPGFIDMHCHSDAIIFNSNRNRERLLCGVTTEVCGNCGTSPAPIYNETQVLLKGYCAATYSGFELPWNWHRFDEFLTSVAKLPPSLNFGCFVGHGSIRIAIMGFDQRKPTSQELAAMQDLLRSSLHQGAIGLSAGLIYPPGVFADKEELIALARVVKEENKLFAVHMRNEGNHVIESVKEMVQITDETGVRMQISHHKIAGLKNMGSSDMTLRLIEECYARGADIGIDAYPYTAGCTQLSAILPPWVHEGGMNNLLERLQTPEVYVRIRRQIQSDDSYDNLAQLTSWDRIIISNTGSGRFVGWTIAEIADERSLDPLDCALRLILEERNDIMMILYTMSDYDVERILANPLTSVATDGVPSGTEAAHPRYLGSFLRVLALYQRERGLLSLETAVHKMTGMPAARCGLHDRGVIAPGKKADFLLIRLDGLQDVTTYEQPNRTNDHVRWVFVNGIPAVLEHRLTGADAGRVV